MEYVLKRQNVLDLVYYSGTYVHTYMSVGQIGHRIHISPRVKLFFCGGHQEGNTCDNWSEHSNNVEAQGKWRGGGRPPWTRGVRPHVDCCSAVAFLKYPLNCSTIGNLHPDRIVHTAKKDFGIMLHVSTMSDIKKCNTGARVNARDGNCAF